MGEEKLDAILLTGGTSLLYFTGVRWGNSERLFAVRHPVKGEPFFVCPAFEEDRAREQLALGPLGAHRRPDLAGGREPVRTRRRQGSRTAASQPDAWASRRPTKFVFADSIASAAPALKVVSATPVTAGCRMIKDAHEVELMRLACEGDAEVLRGGVSRRCSPA